MVTAAVHRKPKMLLIVPLLVLLLGIVPVSHTEAEMTTAVTLRPMLTLVNMPFDEDWMFTGLGTVGVSFLSEGNKNVKAQLDMDLTVADNVLFDVSRAYVKVRFPVFRSVLGKNRISWGEGVMFNAGDLIAATSGMVADLTQDVYHDQGVWMAEAFIPFGRFSFGELVVLPPVPTLFPVELGTAFENLTTGGDGTEDLSESLSPSPTIEDTALGGRIYLKPFGIKTEAGYLYNGEEQLHQPYLSLQGHLLVDIHASASTGIPTDQFVEDTQEAQEEARELDPDKDVDEKEEIREDVIKEQTEISWGLFWLYNFRSGASISLRLESMIKPWAEWEPIEYDPENEEVEEDYGILLYPEIVVSPTQGLSFIARSVFSPIDFSGLFTLGTSWNIYQNFSILGYTSIQAGHREDLFGWDRNGDFSVSIGFEFTY